MNQHHIMKLAATLGIELNNSITMTIVEKTKDFNHKAFVNFCEEIIDDMRLQYKTPYQKFLAVVKIYTKEINAPREEEARTNSQELEAKFKKVKYILLKQSKGDTEPKLHHLYTKGQSYFTKWEISQLNAIGDVKYLIKMDNEYQLQKKLEENFIKIIYKKPHVAIEQKNREEKKALYLVKKALAIVKK